MIISNRFNIEKYLFYTILFVTVLIILNGSYLPMVDLPQHAGQVAALNDLIKGNSHWKELVELNFNTPYLVGYMSWLILLQFFDIVTSSRILVSLIFLLFVFSVNKLRKEFDSPNIVTWIAIPSFFGFNYEWGFITFLIAVSVGILFFIKSIRLSNDLSFGNCFIFLSFGLFLFYSHILSFLFFCLLSFVYTCFNVKDKKIILKIIPVYFIFFLFILFYLTFGDSLAGNYEYGENIIYHTVEQKIINLFIYPFSMTGSIFSINSIFLMIIPILMGFGFSRKIKKIIPLVVFLLVWFSLPHFFKNTYFIYERYSILFFIFYYLVFEENKIFKYGFYFKILFIVLILNLLVYDYKNIFFAKKESKDFSLLINNLPEEKRILGLIFEPVSPSLTVPFTYIHFGSWYQAQKHGWSDFNFAWFHPQIVRYKPNQTPEVKPGFEWRPYDVVALKSCHNYDMFIVRAYDVSVANIIKKSPCHNYTLRLNEGNWFIFSK